jgi:hypothetical protein
VNVSERAFRLMFVLLSLFLISTVTGAEVVLFTLSAPPLVREPKNR